MSDSAQNLDRVNHLAAELQSTYTEVPVEQQEVLPAAEFTIIMADDEADYVGGAAAWVAPGW